MSIKDIVVFDIDGTLTIVGDRVKHLAEKDWNTFYKRCDEDLPNIPIVDLCRKLQEDYKIVFITGRKEFVRNETISWLREYGIWRDSHQLYMRGDKDHRHDTKVKPEVASEFLHKIRMVFEDRSSMVDKWRELGVTCLQVAEGNF